MNRGTRNITQCNELYQFRTQTALVLGSVHCWFSWDLLTLRTYKTPPELTFKILKVAGEVCVFAETSPTVTIHHQ